MKLNKVKEQKGSITLFVLLSILFFMIVLVGLFMNSNNRMQKQEKEIDRIQESYNSVDPDKMYQETIEKMDKAKTNWKVVPSEGYVFESNGNKWTSNNTGISNSTANTSWTIKVDENTVYTIKYKVSSELNNDIFSLELDGAKVVEGVSGDREENTVNVNLIAGKTHTLNAIYSKNNSTNSFEDMAYIILEPIE